MRRAVYIVLLVCALGAATTAARRDPLNQAEVNQLRDAAQEPDKRLLLFVKFIRARMDALEKTHSDPRIMAGRWQQVHDLLEDLDALVQEMDDNVEEYAKRRYDIRKPLVKVIELDGELQSKLRAIKEAAGAEMKDYAFALENAIESVNSSLDSARQVAQEQEAAVEAAKKAKKK
ncbi:MAG: hypothetical protein ACE14L_14050 [Terriglobales bacterium]